MKLILHFDVNKTIIISDASCGISTKTMLKNLLTECIWGTLSQSAITKPKEERVLVDWILLSKEPTSLPPIANAISFSEFLEFHTSIERMKRKQLKADFFDTIGKGLYHHVDELETHLKYPESMKNIFENQNENQTNESINSQPYLSDGYYHILPSFFHLILSLKQQNINFKIVFRTFGSDIPNIANEYNLFCENKHILFPFTNNNLNDLQLNIMNDCYQIKRNGPNSEDIQLINKNVSHEMFFSHIYAYFCDNFLNVIILDKRNINWK